MKIEKITTSKKSFNLKNTVDDLLNDFWAVQQKANGIDDKVEAHFDDIVNEALETFIKSDKEYKQHLKELKLSKKKTKTNEDVKKVSDGSNNIYSSDNEYR